MKKHKIVAIIVTFNRVELLELCLDSVCQQTCKPNVVYIIDNASSDGTNTWISANGYDGIKSGIEFRYILLSENIGGAGGFYVGMKTAFETNDNFDAFWLLDDDGIAEAHQLERLQVHLAECDYLSPLVVDKENPHRISFGAKQTIQDFISQKGANNGVIHSVAFPFNGVLYSRKLVEQVGFPVKDMFIWGDEANYHWRCVENGHNPELVVDAVHVHPADRQVQETIIRNHNIVVPTPNWKLYCYVRNWMYNIKTVPSYRRYTVNPVRMLVWYFLYFTFYSFDWRRLGIVYRAMWDGFRKDLSRLDNYR